jgi:hypothetical protein
VAPDVKEPNVITSTPASVLARIRTLRKNHPYFTVRDLELMTGYSPRDIRAALDDGSTELPTSRPGLMPVYAMREIAD